MIILNNNITNTQDETYHRGVAFCKKMRGDSSKLYSPHLISHPFELQFEPFYYYCVIDEES